MQLENLIKAEAKAQELFNEIENRNLIVFGKSEKQLNKEVFDLAFEMFGIKKYWHKRIVRSGRNTLLPYRENPPDLNLQADDILFFDFGPVFDEWESDFGRTYVLGNDPYKLKLKEDIESAWHEGKAYFDQQESITGAEFYRFNQLLAQKYGWEFGGPIAGHLIGSFPHEKIEGESRVHYIHPNNHINMREPGINGQRHWILEIHFVDREKEIGGFFEQLMV